MTSCSPAEHGQQQQQLCERIAVLRWVEAQLEPCSVRDATPSIAVQAAMEAAGLCSLKGLADHRSIGLVLSSDGQGGAFFRSKGQALRLCAGSKKHRVVRPRWKILPVWAAERTRFGSCANFGHAAECGSLFLQSWTDHAGCASTECFRDTVGLERESCRNDSHRKTLQNDSSIECSTDNLACPQQPTHSYFDVDTMQMQVSENGRMAETCRLRACHNDTVYVPSLYMKSHSSTCIPCSKDADLEFDQQAKRQGATSMFTGLHDAICDTKTTTALPTWSAVSSIARPLARKRQASHSTCTRRSGMKSQRLPETDTHCTSQRQDREQATHSHKEAACHKGRAAKRGIEPRKSVWKVKGSFHESTSDANVSASALSEDSSIRSTDPENVIADALLPQDTTSDAAVGTFKSRPSEETSPWQEELHASQSSVASSALPKSPEPDEHCPLWLRRIAMGY